MVNEWVNNGILYTLSKISSQTLKKKIFEAFSRHENSEYKLASEL